MTKARELSELADAVEVDGSGNVAFDTDTLFVDASANRVGIGTSSPSQPLNVAGNIAQTATTHTIFTNNIGIVSSAADLSITSGSANLVLKSGTGNTERMRIDSSGNVGIGTSSPSTTLDVQSTNTFVSEFASTNASNTAEIRVRSSGGVGPNTRGRIIGGYDAGGSGYGGYLAFNTTGTSNANSEAMRIDSSGRVGIGTSNPNAKLDVNGQINHSGPIETDSTNSGYTTGQTISVTAPSAFEGSVYQVVCTRHTGTANRILESGYVYYSGNGAGSYAQVIAGSGVSVTVSGTTISAENTGTAAILRLSINRLQ